MSVRTALVALAAGTLLVAGTGCVGFGPKNNRLYPSEWRSKRDSPIRLYTDWTYEGEHWERSVVVEGAPPVRSEDDE